MYFIEFSDANKMIKIELMPSVKYVTNCELPDFPIADISANISPIFHSIQLVSSLELLLDEFDYTEEVESELKGKYCIDNSTGEIILAKLQITEFPDEWRQEIDDNWHNWLDAIDGDLAVVGSRADQIEDENLHDDPFPFGSLYYISRLDVHSSFSGQETGVKLIQYAFKHLIRNASGMVFLIAKPMKSSLSKKTPNFKSSSRLAKYYERGGFTRVTKNKSKDILMEARIDELID